MYNFEEKELGCRCGKCAVDFERMNPETMQKIEAARIIAGIPFTVRSAMRCITHNAAEGGSNDSSHLEGYAIDVEANNSRQRFIIIDALIRAGFTRIGIGRTFIHFDDDPLKDERVVWLYD